MTWLKLDDGFFDHPKAIAAGKDGRALFLAALCWSSRHAQDGAIPSSALIIIAATAGVMHARKAAGVLVDVGLFELAGDGWLIHDYGEYQRSRAEIEKQRGEARQRQRKSRESRRDITVTPPEQPPQSPGSSLAEEELATDVLQGQPQFREWGQDWRPTDPTITWATDRGLSEFQIRRQIERFIAHNLTNGVEVRHPDAAWRGWMRTEVPELARCDMPKRPTDVRRCGLCDAPLVPGLDGEPECSAACEAIYVDLAVAP